MTAARPRTWTRHEIFPPPWPAAPPRAELLPRNSERLRTATAPFKLVRRPAMLDAGNREPREHGGNQKVVGLQRHTSGHVNNERLTPDTENRLRQSRGQVAHRRPSPYRRRRLAGTQPVTARSPTARRRGDHLLDSRGWGSTRGDPVCRDCRDEAVIQRSELRHHRQLIGVFSRRQIGPSWLRHATPTEMSTETDAIRGSIHNADIQSSRRVALGLV